LSHADSGARNLTDHEAFHHLQRLILGKTGTRYFLFFESVVQDSGSNFERQRGMDFVLRHFPGTTALAGQLSTPFAPPGFIPALP
jgi:hypothetical protein